MKKLFLLLFACCSLGAFAQDTTRVLFVGNSYTFVNDLPQILSKFSQCKGHPILYEQFTTGGATFQTHWANSALKQRIEQGGFDYMILQGQSQECAFPPSQFQTQVRPYAKSLDSLFKAHNQGKVIFFMTWGYRYGDAINCEFYPPFCSYESMSQELYTNYRQMALDFGSIVAPVGAAWRYSIEQDSTVVLHSSDNSHPSALGSYLASCVLYSTLFIDSCNTSFYNGLETSGALRLQAIANHIVMDSLAQWNIHTSSIAVASADKESIAISFNPKDKLLIIKGQNQDFASPLQTKIYNMQGMVVLRQQIKATDKTLNCAISVKNLAKGAYVLTITNGKFLKHQTFIINH